MDKLYFNWVVDHFEADMHETTKKAFNKRSSVSKRGGRPYLYSPREIGEIMVRHFRDCVKYNQPFTITGLCLQLGISRQGMLKMEKSSKEELVDMIKKGRAMVEFYLETQLTSAPNPAFAIFILKNMGWSDKMTSKTKVNSGMTDKERVEAQERIKNFSE